MMTDGPFQLKSFATGSALTVRQFDLAAQVLTLLSPVPYTRGGSQGHSLTNTLHTNPVVSFSRTSTRGSRNIS